MINCRIEDQTGRYDGASYSFPFTREMAEELLGGDVRPFSASAEALKNFIDRVTSMSLE
ncbi:MAG: hypothetical protein RQM92_11975 [Candidatus Syntrophopropionicum ammoniitolerans]